MSGFWAFLGKNDVFSKMFSLYASVRPYCMVWPYSTAILGFLGTAVHVWVRPKIMAIRRTILSLHFLVIFQSFTFP